MSSVKVSANQTIAEILNSISFTGKFNILVINKTENPLRRVGAYHESGIWPIVDIEPNTAQADKITASDSFSTACNYEASSRIGIYFQFVAISPIIGSQKIGLSGMNQSGNGPARSAWDRTDDRNDKLVNNNSYEARASLQKKDSSLIWVYEVKSQVVEQPVPEKPPINSPVIEQPVPEKPPIDSPVIEPPAPEKVVVNPVVDRLVLKQLYDMRLPAEHIARCLEQELGSNTRALVEASIKQLAENGLIEKVDLDYPETFWTATPKGEDYKGDSALSIKEEILGEKQSRVDKAILRILSRHGIHNLDLDSLMSSSDNTDPYWNRYREMERYRPPMRGGGLTMESLLREVHEYELGVYTAREKIPAIQASLQRLKDNGMIEKIGSRSWDITDKGNDFMYS
jgi:hypothetical protein